MRNTDSEREGYWERKLGKETRKIVRNFLINLVKYV